MKYLMLLILPLVLLGCAEDRTAALKNKTGEHLVETISTAENVEVNFLLPEKSERILLNAEQVARLKELILNDGHYTFDRMKTTPFFAEAAFHFGYETTLFVSRSAKQIQIVAPGKKVKLDNDPVAEKLEQFLEDLR
ncbi:MAG: hypothetical protein KDK48_05180 [Chlamydiia bacterium]|nr:hypothetical protein [Chlamydiia bacterium]